MSISANTVSSVSGTQRKTTPFVLAAMIIDVLTLTASLSTLTLMEFCQGKTNETFYNVSMCGSAYVIIRHT